MDESKNIQYTFISQYDIKKNEMRLILLYNKLSEVGKVKNRGENGKKS